MVLRQGLELLFKRDEAIQFEGFRDVSCRNLSECVTSVLLAASIWNGLRTSPKSGRKSETVGFSLWRLQRRRRSVADLRLQKDETAAMTQCGGG